MPALDTNVLVRFLVEDDLLQLAAARRLITKCVREGLTLYVPVTVVLELEWVLRKSFGFVKHQIIEALSNLLLSSEMSFESEHALEVALQLFNQGAADFADCLHIALASQAGEQPLWTFDRSAAKVSGAKLLNKADKR